VYNVTSDAFRMLKEFQITDAASQDAENDRKVSGLRSISFLGLLVGIAAAASGWFSLRRAIMTPLAEALEHFEHISAGDLTRAVPIKTHDEMGQLLAGIAAMKEKLAETVGSLRSSGETIACASTQIAAGNIDLSSRTEASRFPAGNSRQHGRTDRNREPELGKRATGERLG
jgi:methyl-accepting chemotaxis protein-1 (serine sensor receptor)